MKRTIIALGAIALALALAGGAWAGKRYLITSSSQVKPGSLTGQNIKNHSLGLNELSTKAKAGLKGERGGEARRATPARPACRGRRATREIRATRETRETPVPRAPSAAAER